MLDFTGVRVRWLAMESVHLTCPCCSEDVVLRYVSGYWLIYPPKIANISQIRVEIQGPQMQLVFGTPHWKGQYSVAWDIGISSGNDCTYKTQFLSNTVVFPEPQSHGQHPRWSGTGAAHLLFIVSEFQLANMSQFGTKEHALHFQSLFPDRIDSKTSRKKSPNSSEERVIYEDWGCVPETSCIY